MPALPSLPAEARAVCPSSSDQSRLLLGSHPTTILSGFYLTSGCVTFTCACEYSSFLPRPDCQLLKDRSCTRRRAQCEHVKHVFTCQKLSLASLLHSEKFPFPESAAHHEREFFSCLSSFYWKAGRKVSQGNPANSSFTEPLPSLWGALWHVGGGLCFPLGPRASLQGQPLEFFHFLVRIIHYQPKYGKTNQYNRNWGDVSKSMTSPRNASTGLG